MRGAKQEWRALAALWLSAAHLIRLFSALTPRRIILHLHESFFFGSARFFQLLSAESM